MAINPGLTKRVRDVFPKDVLVEEKKMFGGIAFMVHGKMCVTVSGNRIMCRIDPALHSDAILQPGVNTMKMKGRDYIGWIYVDESVVPDKKKLLYWVKLALDFNEKIK